MAKVAKNHRLNHRLNHRSKFVKFIRTMQFYSYLLLNNHLNHQTTNEMGYRGRNELRVYGDIFRWTSVVSGQIRK